MTFSSTFLRTSKGIAGQISVFGSSLFGLFAPNAWMDTALDQMGGCYCVFVYVMSSFFYFSPKYVGLLAKFWSMNELDK